MTDIFQPAQYAYLHTGSSCVVKTSKVELESFQDFSTAYFSGVALGKFGFISGDFSKQSHHSGAVDELADASGEWMAIARDSNSQNCRFLVFGDASGFCPIFYSILPDSGVIVSDSFHGVVRGIKESGSDVTLNIAHYVTSITAHHLHFENPSVEQTMANEIYILRRDQALEVKKDELNFIPRSLLGDANRVDNYESALSHGVESLTRSLQSLSQDPELIKTINLSGGVDSRMALSFITTAGLESEFSINSSDPRTWHNPSTRETIERDVAIANQIRSDLDMSWAEKDNSSLLQFDFQDSLAFHQGFRSNFSFNFRPNFGHSIFETPRLTIRGGGGELLRATATGGKISTQIQQIYTNDVSSNVELVKKWYLRRSPTDGIARDLIEKYFSGLGHLFRGDSLEESLNTYYQNTRNRTHFGHLRQSHTTNNTSIHLLANSYFIRAGELLPFEVKKNGKLVKDIFAHTDPSLLQYEFENQESTQELTKAGYDKVDISYSTWESDYDVIAHKKSKTSVVPNWSAQSRGIVSPYDRAMAAKSYLYRAFRIVEDLAGDEFGDVIRQIHQSVKQRISKNPTQLFSAVAKVASAVDLQFPVILNGNTLHLHCTSDGKNRRSGANRLILPRVVPRDGWNDRPVLEVDVSLLSIKGKLVAEARTNVVPLTGTRFAFHLYRGKEKVAQSWYAESQRRTFDIPDRPGTYSVRCYWRSSGNSMPSYSLSSPQITIN